LCGQIIEGKLSDISGVWEDDGESGRHYIVTVSYNFQDPFTGEPISGDSKATRNDLSSSPLPPVGTKVAIRYVDKSLYRVL
jgi:hypothetical protein